MRERARLITNGTAAGTAVWGGEWRRDASEEDAECAMGRIAEGMRCGPPRGGTAERIASHTHAIACADGGDASAAVCLV